MKPRDNPSSRYTVLQDLGPEGTGPLLSTESLEQNNHESGPSCPVCKRTRFSLRLSFILNIFITSCILFYLLGTRSLIDPFPQRVYCKQFTLMLHPTP